MVVVLRSPHQRFHGAIPRTPSARKGVAFPVCGAPSDRYLGQVAEVVDDPKLRRIVERHRADEERHATLFRGCLDRLGFEIQPVPDELKVVRTIAEMSGGFEQGVQRTDQVVPIYAMLLAIEQRGVEQFPLIADAFRPHDPETADVFLRVARDEQGHTRYCERIGRHYAPDDATWEAMVELTGAVEAAAFEQVVAAGNAYCANRGWLETSPT